MPGAEAETRIFVERIDKDFYAKHGRRDEYGTDAYGGIRFSRLTNGDSLTLRDLPAGTYRVARYRLVDIVSEGTGKAQNSVYLDRQWIELGEQEMKSISLSRPAGQPISGRVVIPPDLKINTLVVHVCSENARSSGSLNHRDVQHFDALNADADGQFKTEPLPPGRYKIIVEGYANSNLLGTGIIVPGWEGSALVTVTESNEPAAIEVTLREFDRDAWLKDQTIAANELEFLKAYSKLHGLSLDMTEQQFWDIVIQSALKASQIVDGDKDHHYLVLLGDGHTLIVKFNKDGKCSGIQRVRGDELPAGTQSLPKPALLFPDHWNVMAVGFDNDGKELVTASTQGFVTIRRWNVVGKKLIGEIKLEGDKPGREFREETLTLSADRRRVIAATDEYVGNLGDGNGQAARPSCRFKTKEGIYECRIDRLDCTPDFSVIVGHWAMPGRLKLWFTTPMSIVWDGASGKAIANRDRQERDVT